MLITHRADGTALRPESGSRMGRPTLGPRSPLRWSVPETIESLCGEAEAGVAPGHLRNLVPSRRHAGPAALAVAVLLAAVRIGLQGAGYEAELADLMYIPILLAGWCFGVVGGLAAGVTATLLVGPFGAVPQTTGEMWVGATVYAGIGSLGGWASSELQRRLQSLASLANQLQRAHTRSLSILADDPDWRLIADFIPHGVWVKRPDGRTEYVNRRGIELLGGAEAMPPEGDWTELVHPEDLDATRTGWARAARDRTAYESHFRIRCACGEYRWMAALGVPILGPGSEIVRWIGTLTDVDEVKRTEEDLRAAERRAAETITLLETLQSAAPIGFLFIDRDLRYRLVNQRMSEIDGVPVEDHYGRTVPDVVPHLWPELEPLYRRVLDHGEAVIDREITTEVPGKPGELFHSLVSHYPVVLHEEVIGVGVVVVDITDLKRTEQGLANLTRATVAAMVRSVEVRDPYTAGHQARVADLAAAVAAELGLPPHDVEGIRLAAQIHDIGKLGIPAEILSSPARLRPTEMDLVREHARFGHDIVADIDFPWPVAEMVLQHHERHDGSGYPNGLAGGEICPGARIIAVADTVEAMASHRPYRPARGLDAAIEHVRDNRGRLFDPDVVDACLRLAESGSLPGVQ